MWAIRAGDDWYCHWHHNGWSSDKDFRTVFHNKELVRLIYKALKKGCDFEVKLVKVKS